MCYQKFGNSYHWLFLFLSVLLADMFMFGYVTYQSENNNLSHHGKFSCSNWGRPYPIRRLLPLLFCYLVWQLSSGFRRCPSLTLTLSMCVRVSAWVCACCACVLACKRIWITESTVSVEANADRYEYKCVKNNEKFLIFCDLPLIKLVNFELWKVKNITILFYWMEPLTMTVWICLWVWVYE